MFSRLVHHFFINWSKKYSRKGIHSYLETKLSLISSGMKSLNVGAGGSIQKIIINFFAHNNISVNTISIDIDLKRNPNIIGDVCTLPFIDNCFDVISLMEVLEHIHNPQKALNEIYRVLKPEGLLIFSVPFIFPLHDRPDDYFRFTKYGLTHLLSKYYQVEVVERNSFSEAIAVLIVRLIMEKGYRPKILAMLFMLSGAILLTHLFNYIIKSDALTTGYVGSAKKSTKLTT